MPFTNADITEKFEFELGVDLTEKDLVLEVYPSGTSGDHFLEFTTASGDLYVDEYNINVLHLHVNYPVLEEQNVGNYRFDLIELVEDGGHNRVLGGTFPIQHPSSKRKELTIDKTSRYGDVVGIIAAPKGEAGAKGETGDKGLDGDKGDLGDTGILQTGSPTTHVVDFTVTVSDMKKIHILEPIETQILQVTLPPASSFINEFMTFKIPADGTLGRAQFLATPGQATSLIEYSATDQFWMFPGESVTFYATASKWNIMDSQKIPLVLLAKSDLVNKLVPGDQSFTNIDGINLASDPSGTLINSGKWMIDNQNQIYIPRAGVYNFQFTTFLTFSGTTPPTGIYGTIDYPSFAGISGRAYADFIQPVNPSQAVVSMNRTKYVSSPASVPIGLHCVTNDATMLHATSATQIEVTEVR